MPELPEVETTVRGLRPVLQGRRLVRVEPRRADLRRAIPADLRQRMTGARVVGLRRRAKYGLIDTDRGDTLVFHLGMSGRWRVDPEEIGTHDHLLIETEEGRRLALNDPRRFGSLDLLPTDAVEDFPAFRALGPEPLGPEMTADYLARRLDGRIAPIKLLLLDQRVVAGLGNIYVCEALNLSRINPRKPGGAVSRPALARLVAAIPQVLEAAIEAGGSTLRDYARPDGELGYFSKQFRVYGREEQPCPFDGGTILRQVDGGRSTWWCPKCQR
ncbi:bifunctional DNA-formamidopyrimidine glycosylase/DNA-(apurinic or apyrimidinic site) lyase [uncultured Sphingomonas sp.]|uniref:bifunctional DNA-formamidopyrimidine glycosylase/DNA-(apurinic or apyrimidinic site) lyase n=1 Tax=uncultured Sphingomonas sp. TaxID=158754 RepID=UPI0025FE5CF3|nr:bifunctional DNA-formamidopyrimidine glycosylase/DNA-(apurinic or apyrimidinic site) lyase [uncultured Sphingomonas sp.]